MAHLVLNKLSKVYHPRRGGPVYAVKDLSLEVADRELLILAGPSGLGKTTTLRLIAGLEEPTSGTISMDDQIINKLKPHERDVAMVFQSDALFPHLRARDNIALGLRLRKVAKPEIALRVEEAAGLLEIASCLDRFPGELSGGERRRVALGRAMVRRPKLFLLDEPLSNLDAELRVRMRELIERLHRQLGATMIMVTHDELDARGHRLLRLTKQ
jgi:ABC-type sugar transport system ATPase subunit